MADEKEKFDPIKLLKGFIDPVTWSKSGVYLVMIVVILFICLTIYRAYFMRNQQQKTEIHVAAGGTANITNVQKSGEKKRAWWLPIPYISVAGVAQNGTRDKLSDIKYGYKGEFGIRLDF